MYWYYSSRRGADFPEVILDVPSTSQGEPEMLKGIDALGTIGILLKAIQELKAEIEELKIDNINPSDSHHWGFSLFYT